MGLSTHFYTVTVIQTVKIGEMQMANDVPYKSVYKYQLRMLPEQ
jgi:hypothetical protein